MRRLLAVAFLGLAVAAATDASAQGRPGGRGRGHGGVADTARMRVRDSIRVARGDTAFHRRGADSLHQGPPEGRGRGPAGRGGMMPGRGGLMGIQLNDNEKAAVKAINEKYRAEFEQLREANKGTAGQNAQLRTQVQAIADRQQAEIRGALTAEHQAQFDANVAKRKERGAKGPAGRRPPRPPAPADR